MDVNNVKGYLISESAVISAPKIISDKSGEPTIIEVLLQDGDVKNRNGRIYPTEVIKKGLTSEYVQERLATKTWYGEAGHPLNPTVERQLYIDQSNISHIITAVDWKDNLLYGVVESALTERGKDFQGLIRQGSKVAFSLRAFGPVCEKKGDTVYVRDPLHILCFDWVIHPSHRCAYMQNVIQESGSFIDKKLNEKALSESGYFFPITKSSITEFICNESTNAKQLLDQLEIDKNKAYANINTKDNIIYFKESADILAVCLEDYIANDLDRYMANL